ncbi:MAG: hypothetical protein COC01_09475 [Bacteroidetes bacterium]|nr:MAG: hypothetical protein COC01_09475 [Bacteroidota bacterium]
MKFAEYLQQHKYAASTIHAYVCTIDLFEQWCGENHIDHNIATYNDLLSYIQYQQEHKVTNPTINIRLNSISKYYDHLMAQGTRTGNAARDLRVKSGGYKVLKDLLTPQRLEDIYGQYTNRPAWSFREEKSTRIHQRNTVILGLMVFQGLHAGELKRLEAEHIDLPRASIYIPSTRRSNSRILKLKAIQMLYLQQHLTTRSDNNILLFKGNLHTILAWLIRGLRQQGRLVRSAKQLRASVIAGWTKRYNIRQVQYMCGHRHISSTERYQQQGLEDLKAAIEQYHPGTG